MRVGVVFPGQGSQVVGMGVDVATGIPAAAELFARASNTLGYDLLDLCRKGPEEKLRETRYSQPAIFVVNYALAASVGEVLGTVVSAGHSFGEYCSLVLSGALDFDEALSLVDARAEAMQAAASRAPGAMSAILGLEVEKIEAAVQRVRGEKIGRVALANFNAPQQIVISGDAAAVRRAGDLCLVAGAKRVVALNVSGAWHSELMAPAVVGFGPKVNAAQIVPPRFPVISNVDARAYESVEQIKANLVRSVTDEVLWHDTALALVAMDL
ncbi:MAG: ACP S-malonyltransferase, partial [Candidatus Eremiobacteraeota bacterium]|nr:ACP S-malonyltransferase [Candidatus Eremiobacteraeota bacterium]